MSPFCEQNQGLKKKNTYRLATLAEARECFAVNGTDATVPGLIENSTDAISAKFSDCIFEIRF